MLQWPVLSTCKYTRAEETISDAISQAIRELNYDKLRPQQELVIRKFVGGGDVFVCLLTGSGKSQCYCLLPAIFDHLRCSQSQSVVVVVSPLITLMKDQVRAMSSRNVSAIYRPTDRKCYLANTN